MADSSKERLFTYELTRVTDNLHSGEWRASKNKANPSSVSLLHPRLIVDKDEIWGERDRHRGCGLTQYVDSWTVAHEPLAYQSQANKHNKRTGRTLATGSYYVSHHGRFF